MTLLSLPPLRRLRFAALAALMAALLPAHADVINVSSFVLGAGRPQVAPIVGATTPTFPCGTACQYAGVSNIGADAGYLMAPEPYTASTWPPVYAAGLPSVGSVSETLTVPAPPAGMVADGGSVGVARQASVQYDWSPVPGGTRVLGVQTWKGGSGIATVCITIRVTPTADKKAHFLEFVVPRSLRQQLEAWNLLPGTNQPTSLPTTQMQARSAVDVYADGMPVWSGESASLAPPGWSSLGADSLVLDWGPALDESRVTLFLGALPVGVPRTISLIFRTDLRVIAGTCLTANTWGATYQRCDTRREALSLPSLLSSNGGPLQFVSYRPDVRIFTL